MKTGITMFSTCRGMSPAKLAVAVEERGFASLHLPEHSHIPASRLTPFPGASPSRPELPDIYWHLNGLVTSLAMAAAATETLVVGSSVMLLPQHDPIWLAKELATIDHYAGGRLELGVGFGWNREELEAHGIDWATRRERARDCIGVMRALWRDHPASFKGEIVGLEPSWSHPKLPGHGPPVLLGGELRPLMLGHLAEWANGWIPILHPRMDLATEVARLSAAFEAAGRDPADVLVTACNAPQDQAGLAALAELGVQRAALTLWAEAEDDVLRELDRLALLLA
jgi:probable F420-dependent oxidoreductase